MAKLSDKLLFSDYPNGSIIPIGEGEPGDSLMLQAFTSPSGLPKHGFYEGDEWEEVSGESLQTKGELSIIMERGNEIEAFLTPVTKIVEYGAGQATILFHVQGAMLMRIALVPKPPKS